MTPEFVTQDDDDFLNAFAGANLTLAAEPFTTHVLRRVRRRVWIRRAVIGAARLIGALAAIGPSIELTAQSEIGLRTFFVQWRDVARYSQYGLTLVFLSIGVGWSILARWLAR